MTPDGVAVAFQRGDDVLLGIRAVDDDGYGRWELVGGQPEPKETPEQAARREAAEEISVAAVELGQPSEVSFINTHGGPSYRAMIYTCRTFEGEPTPSQELIPRWFDRRHLPYDKMWPADRYWLPLVLHGHRLSVQVESAGHDAQEVVKTVAARVERRDWVGAPEIIFLVGPTSAGKSTLAAYIAAAVQEQTGRPCTYLSTDTVVQVQFPDAVVGAPQTFDTPYEMVGGRVVFHPRSRRELSERAVAGLGVLTAEFLSRRADPSTIICEFPGAMFQPLLSAIESSRPRQLRVWVAELDAEPGERHQRNRGRGDARLDPDAAIAMDASLDDGRFRDDLLKALGGAICGYVAIRTDGPLDEAVARIQRAFEWALPVERPGQ